MRRRKGRAKFRRKLSTIRKRLIRRNAHPVKLDKKQALYTWTQWWRKKSASFRKKYSALMSKVLKQKAGRRMLRKFTRFTGLPYPTDIKIKQLPGPKNRSTVLMGMGRSPRALIADGPEGKNSGTKQIRGTFTPVATPDGKILLLSGKNSQDTKGKKKFAGYAPETHYIPTSEMERAGTFKRGKYWVHLHGKEEDGRWPKVFIDSAGNVHYGKSTYRISDWLYR